MSLRDLIIIRPVALTKEQRLSSKIDRLINRYSAPRRIRGDFSYDAGFDAGYVAALKKIKSLMDAGA